MKSLTVKPLKYITPSRVFALEQCFLRVAFGLDKQYSAYRTYSPRARLGSITHSILEKVSKGILRDKNEAEWESSLLRLWNEEVKKNEQEVLASESERHYGVAERWPRYNLQKALTIRKALEIATSLQKSAAYKSKGSWETEQYIQAFDGKINGRADAIYQSEQGIEIIDYKTGNIYDEDENGNSQLKTKYRRQLLLYAAMYHAEAGEWPVSGHIIPLVGQQVTIEIDPVAANGEVLMALFLLNQFNKCVSEGDSLLSLAQPSEQSCRYCTYKTICPAV